MEENKRKLSKWIKIPLWIIGALLFIVILIPILLYIPPVQTFVKDVAANIVEKSTGMKIQIDRFRLKWPVDVSLDGVHIIEASGDTMVYAKEVIADVKMAPLFKLDVDINELKLVDAGLRILSPDSSMLLKLKANLIDIDDKSSVDIKKLIIDLNKVVIKGADLSLDMDVWKKAPASPDTAPLDLKILLHDVEIENFSFGMAMLPTIDTLSLSTKSLIIRNGDIDLSQNKITADYISTSEGFVDYYAPTPEYVSTHPMPVDTTGVESAPIVIIGDTIRIEDFRALYAIKGAKPLPGFDPSYIQVSDVNIQVDSFYNEASTVRLPITEITANERSGLSITAGHGTIQVDSTGLSLGDLYIQTPYSNIGASANIPFAFMEMKPNANFNVNAEGSVGWPDIESFMPDLASYTKKLPERSPLKFDVAADGSLEDIILSNLDISIKDVLQIEASGQARNAMDLKKLEASIKFE